MANKRAKAGKARSAPASAQSEDRAQPPKRGRPSVYEPKYDRIAHRFALLGATDAQLADALGVTVTTITNWKAAHPSFLAALRQGKDVADARVVESLYRRAIGYEHPAVKIVTVSQGAGEGSVVEQVPYTERYPPDSTAMIFWLKNRRPSEWRDKLDHEHSGRVTLEKLLEAVNAKPQDE